MDKQCQCGKTFYCIPALLTRKKYCSKKCFYKYRKIPIWNKGLKGIHLSPKTEFKKGIRYSKETEFKKGHKPINPIKKGEHRGWNTEFGSFATKGVNNIKWKGDNVGYGALHGWVRRNLGKASKCSDEKCDKKSKRFEWANKSGNYKRNINDWLELCKKCHTKYDKDSWGNATKLWKLNK